jgi:hypothetical protein
MRHHDEYDDKPARFAVEDRVIYTGWNGKRIRTTVEGNEGDKDGRRVYDLACGNWAYEDQLEKDK